jgi:hypothetical protein
MCLSVSLYRGCYRQSRPGRPLWYVCCCRSSGYSDEYSDEYSGENRVKNIVGINTRGDQYEVESKPVASRQVT